MRLNFLRALLAPLSIAMAIVSLSVSTVDAQYTILHEFSGADNGSYPQYAGVALSGGTLYGTTSGGGSYGPGTLYKVNTDGANFSLLYSFTGGADGGYPNAGPILGGSTLYGTTRYGGIAGSIDGLGTIYKINTDGTDFTALHAFSFEEAGRPTTNLTLSGTALYGITYHTITGFPASIFRLNTDGSGYTSLHTFSESESGGKGALVVSGNVIYGTTEIGGPAGGGAVFTLNTDGTGFHLLRHFGGTSEDGSGLNGALTLSGTKLFGTTLSGGVIDGHLDQGGTIFTMNTDGTDFQTIHTFSTETGGKYPSAGLTLIGDTLFGTTSQGGNGNFGTIFRIGTDGTNYTELHEFSGDDGAQPTSEFTTDGSFLYATTSLGGSANSGVLFSIPVPEPASAVLLAFSAAYLGMRRQRQD